jgi:asparagine synthase (glutamine-hydrolysing)
MFLMARVIRSFGIKMVLSGEGADELFGGYLYFHKAPSDDEFDLETRDKLRFLPKFDCLRANKATMAWGVEARVPFLDVNLLQNVLHSIPTRHRRCGPGVLDTSERQEGIPTTQEGVSSSEHARMEKALLRAALATGAQLEDGRPLLPDSVLWRQKEQFSDGVGYQWIDGIKEHSQQWCREQLDLQDVDQICAYGRQTFPVNPPETAEALWVRTLWDKQFGHHVGADRLVHGGPTVACSTARAMEWDASFRDNADPSGRSVLGVHVDPAANH